MKNQTTTWVNLAVCALLAVSAAGMAEADTPSLEALRAERARLRDRPRRIIFNNDGCDALYFPADREVTPQNLLAVRTSPLRGSQVDTIAYCTISSGFGYFTHRTEVGDILDKEWDYHRERNQVNATRALMEQGTDPLQVIIDFCREEGIEAFWSMRMNDTHDVAHTPSNPYPLFSPLKQRHPEWLMGTFDQRPSHGRWSAVDYTHSEIRELAFRYIEEVCRNYDIDGIELDFFRHLQYFRSVSRGGQASPEELEMMTDLMRRIRDMTETEGLRRGRPFLIAIRVPDSVAYSRALGLDIERWLAEGLVDLLFTTCYFRLNEWDYTVALAHRHGIRAYPGLSETRVTDRRGTRDRRRGSDAAYRARAAAAWQAGADGIYVFNEYNAGREYLRQIGAPQTLAGHGQVYFATVLGPANLAHWVPEGSQHLRRPSLNPLHPVILSVTEPWSIDLPLGSWSQPGMNRQPRVAAWFNVQGPYADESIEARLNGNPLARGGRSDSWLEFQVDPDALRAGSGNRFEISRREIPGEESVAEWTLAYDGRQRLRWPSQLPWRRAFTIPGWVEEIRDEAMYFADLESGEKWMANLAYPWHADPAAPLALEASVRLDHSDDPLAVCIRFANGRAIEYLTIEEGAIGLYHAGLSAEIDTTSGFRVYRVDIEGDDILVSVDGEPVIEGAGRFTTPADDTAYWLPLTEGLMDWNANSLLIGSASGPGTGAAWWRDIRYATPSVLLADFRLEVTFPSP